MKILVDSSIWIDYFGSGENSATLDKYIDQNLIYINDLILAELIPFLKIKKQFDIIELLYEVESVSLDINWQKLIDYQTLCLSNGINKVGIPDLIILDNIIQNDLTLYTLDKHFRLLNHHINFELI